jgi:hypothetical protein
LSLLASETDELCRPLCLHLRLGEDHREAFRADAERWEIAQDVDVTCDASLPAGNSLELSLAG